MAVILASGTTETGSSDFTVASGGTATVFLTDAAGPMVDSFARAHVQIKATNLEYYDVVGGRLDRDMMQLCVAAPGTYRVLRRTANAAFAIEQV